MSDRWEPVAEHRLDVVSATAARALHDLLDRAGDAPSVGDRLPILWHWLAFLPRSPQAGLGPDGHPSTGGFLPPAHGKQRMYAGGKVAVDGLVSVGDPLARGSKVTSVTDKRSAAGPLKFVTVEHNITGSAGLIDERSDIVYKEQQPFSARARDAGGHDSAWAWARSVAVTPPLLFRFSALTYNAHRIHYDRDYATGAECYPGLVVHGPLQAILLADAVDRAHPDQVVSSFSFRATAPAFDDHELHLRLRPSDVEGRLELAALSDGRVTMTATATFAPRERPA